MAISIWERHRRKSPLVERFGKTLREANKDTVQRPLPERWVELIKRLNEEEARRREEDH